MCLSPIRIPNNAKYVDIQHGARAFYTVQCGKCAECRNNKINEYVARSQAEYKYTKDNGGYTYFETLTYHNGCVPKFFGINVFSPRDITLFFKDVNSRLRRAGYYRLEGEKKIVDIKYFLTCEYGSQTHRPHYHFMLYVLCKHITNHNIISPSELFKILKASWQDKGILDIYKKDKQTGRAVRYKSPDEKVIPWDDRCKIIAYVTKYVNKDDEFVVTLENKVKELKANSNIDKKLFDDSVLRSVSPFHRQSQGYGISLAQLDDINEKLLYTEGKIRICDTRKVWRKIPIPQYIMRKLFMEQVRLKDGSLSWHYTEKGKKWKLGLLDSKIKKLASNIDLLVKNASCISKDSDLLVSKFNSYMLGRDSYFLAEYLMIYKDRLISPTQLLCSPHELLKRDYSYNLCGVNLKQLCKDSEFSNLDNYIHKYYNDYKIDSLGYSDLFYGFDVALTYYNILLSKNNQDKKIHYKQLDDDRKRARMISPYCRDKEKKSALYSAQILKTLENYVKNQS